MTRKSSVLILLTGFVAAVALAGYFIQEGQQTNLGTATLTIKSIGNTTTEKFRFNQVTALGLLKHNHNTEMTYGKYLKCIDGVCANKEYVWVFQVNGEKMNLAANAYRVKDKDNISFVFINKG